MSRRAVPAEPMDTLSIPRELWYPTPVATNRIPAPKPRLSRLVGVLPMVALVSGYTSALVSTTHADAAAPALLLLAAAALLALGWVVAGYAVNSIRHHRSVSQR
jgi:ABC-type polysaccharide/polyol phosphate export permease